MKSGVSGKLAVLTGALLTLACSTLAQEPPAAQEPAAAPAAATPAYMPKFPGDPAHSDAEAGALGYIRTVLMAEKNYKKKHDLYTTSLAGLVHSGSFTQRMIKTDRGDYYVSFHSEGKGTGFNVAMTPKQYDAAHRAFYSDDSGVIRVEENKEATENSPRLK
jgi:hypothetical protein